MVGTIPPTAYLLVSHDTIVKGHFANLLAIAYHFGISISDEGVIKFNGKDTHPHYIMDDGNCTPSGNGWNKHDAIKDWANKHMKLPSDYKIYRYLTT